MTANLISNSLFQENKEKTNRDKNLLQLCENQLHPSKDLPTEQLRVIHGFLRDLATRPANQEEVSALLAKLIKKQLSAKNNDETHTAAAPTA